MNTTQAIDEMLFKNKQEMVAVIDQIERLQDKMKILKDKREKLKQAYIRNLDMQDVFTKAFKKS